MVQQERQHLLPEPSARFVGACIAMEADCGSKACPKAAWDERVGVVGGVERRVGSGGGAGRVEAPGFRILSPEEQLERERVQAEQRPSGQFAADMEERMAVLKAAGVTSAPDSAAMARTNSV